MNSTSYRICFESDPVHYALTNSDLEIIKSSASILPKDFFLASSPVSVACIINAISLSQKPFEWSWGIFLNSLFGGIAFLGSIFFGFSWFKNQKKLTRIYDEIKSRPMKNMQISSSSEDSENANIFLK